MNTDPQGKWTHCSHLHVRFHFWVLLVVGLGGCADASVTPQAMECPSTALGHTVYVYNFAVAASEVTLNQSIFQRAYRKVTDENTSQQQIDLVHQTAQALNVDL